MMIETKLVRTAVSFIGSSGRSLEGEGISQGIDGKTQHDQGNQVEEFLFQRIYTPCRESVDPNKREIVKLLPERRPEPGGLAQVPNLNETV